MKKTIILIFLFVAASASAQIAGGRIKIDSLTVERRGDSVDVNYRARIARRAVRRDHTTVFAPVVVNGELRWSLPAVAVHGRGSRIARERREWVAREAVRYERSTVARGKQTLRLGGTVPFRGWMPGGDVIFESVTGGCCNLRRADDVLAAQGILPRVEQPVKAAVVPATEPQWVPQTVADSLSTAFPFVLPASEFDPGEPFKIYDDERQSAMAVFFRVGKHDIAPDYLDNRYTLANLVGAIEMILAASDSRVERIVVGGFASPEGGAALNDRLSFERAVSVKRYLLQHTTLRDNQVTVYNGSVDWRGLRVRVAESDMPDRDRILDIIDNVPVWDARRQVGRLGSIMRLNGGNTYRHLLREHFPYLRSGAFIRVYYENNRITPN